MYTLFHFISISPQMLVRRICPYSELSSLIIMFVYENDTRINENKGIYLILKQVAITWLIADFIF